jgi:NAD(P)-dependent dehydrogenase (short-subunit alcohol dehydrogenase family)
MNLQDTVAALTGAGSGIGRALALALARAGATVALADRDPAGLAETQRLVQAAGGTSTQHLLDVSDEAAVHGFARAVIDAHGRADVVINNAGVSIFGTVAELTTDEIRWLMDVNFWGVVYGTKAFLPLLQPRPRACIVNVSSVFGIWAPPGQSAYAASKFAVRGFSESLRAELSGTGVRVITVHPGGIKTAIARSSRVAAAADAARAAAMTKVFDERFLTSPPEVVADDVVAAIRSGRDRVLTGNDAARIDLLMRLLPVSVPTWLNRRAARVRPR